MDTIETALRRIINGKRQRQRRKKETAAHLEASVRADIPHYLEQGGYDAFYRAVRELENEHIIAFTQTKETNGRTPPLPRDCWIMPFPRVATWDPLAMLRLQNRLDVSFYQRHPEWQTEAEWTRIKAVHRFLGEKDHRQMVSIEERSLELFGHEKFLTDDKEHPEGKQFLSRLRLTPEDVKATKYGEPFTFWLRPGTELSAVQTVLITENLSFYHAAVQLMNRGTLDYRPELVIYGGGYKIVSSFSFFYKLFLPKDYTFYYVGDLDPEGYSIWKRLVDRYPEARIEPACRLYNRMVRHTLYANDWGGQREKTEDRDAFLSYWSPEDEVTRTVLSLWKEKKRLPQEVLTIETWEDNAK